MAQEAATQVTGSECEVMASIDSSSDGDRLVIAELCREEAYLSVATDVTVDVQEWR